MRRKLLLCLLLVQACSSGSEGKKDDAVGVLLEDRCVTPSGWKPGVAAFKDVSEVWGLTEIQPVGSRISVADIDGDGLPDVFVRRAGRDDFGANGNRNTWLLRNVGGKFEDVTESSGIVAARTDKTLGRPAEVAVFGDVNNDGHVDVVTAISHDGSSVEGAEVLYNQGDGTFKLGEKTAFHSGQVATTVGGLSLTDINRDGLLDVWIGHGATNGSPQQDRLFVQDANGGFKDVTVEQGVKTEGWTLDALNAGRAHSNAWSAAACDLNGDGTPDLLAASYGRAPNHLWLSGVAGSATYSNYSIASGYAFDENQDWTLSHDARCFCEANPSSAGCDKAAAPEFSCPGARGWDPETGTQPFRLGGNSGTTVCADINNDGYLDLLTTEIVHFDVGGNSDPSDILLNDGNATFKRVGKELGLVKPRTSAMWDDGDITAAVFDFDNDGRNDILIASTDYPGTRAYLYRQRADGTFQLLTKVEGIDMKSAHGVVVADFDGDGDLDIMIGHSANRCSSGDHCYPAGERHVRLFENTMGQDSNWVQLRLEGGEGANKCAIGARVTIKRGDQVQVQEVGGGHGHYGLQNDMMLSFGLGNDCEAEVTVRWPDEALSEETFFVQSGYRYRIVQGEKASVLN